MKSWRTYLALALMLLAIFAYVATLDESDPEALPEAVEGTSGENP
jgi:hypothetical protein